MKKEKPVMVTGLASCRIGADVTFAEVDLVYSNGVTRTLRFEPETFLNLLSAVFQMFWARTMKRDAAQGHTLVRAQPATTTMADADAGAQVVILGVKMANGLPASFAIQQAEAEVLHQQLGAAIEKLKARGPSLH